MDIPGINRTYRAKTYEGAGVLGKIFQYVAADGLSGTMGLGDAAGGAPGGGVYGGEPDRGGVQSGGTEESSGPLARLIDVFMVDELLEALPVSPEDRGDFADWRKVTLQCGGWQSWSAGWELGRGEFLPRRVWVVPQLLRYTNRDGDTPGNQESVGHFIAYLRVGDRYLGLASREGKGLPPLTWRFDRRRGRISAEIYDRGKVWKKGELLAEIHVFLARGYFQFKDVLASIYPLGSSLGDVAFLWGADAPRFSGGYESWYNHYTNINEALILEDLDALGKTENLINRMFIQRGRPTVFQIDDGWEQAVGQWEVDTRRFPRSLRPLSDAIRARGHISGLWMAPFILTRSSALFTEKADWVLRDGQGKPVVAGFNDRWDKRDTNFYCLDLSRSEVLEYVDGLVERAIEEWGFRFLKLDFLYAGMLDGRFYGGGAAYEHYQRACEILTKRKRAADGSPVAYLGCGLPFGASYPYFPLSRIGSDTRETWDWPKVKLIRHVGRPSAYVSLLDTLGRSYLDGTVFLNDPDVVFLRSENCTLTENEKEMIALVNYLFASQLMFSDSPGKLKDQDLVLTDRIVGLYDRLPREPYGLQRLERDRFVLFSKSGAVVGLLNLRSRPWTVRPDNPWFTGLRDGTPLVDHRVERRDNRLTFLGRSISLFKIR